MIRFLAAAFVAVGVSLFPSTSFAQAPTTTAAKTHSVKVVTKKTSKTTMVSSHRNTHVAMSHHKYHEWHHVTMVKSDSTWHHKKHWDIFAKFDTFFHRIELAKRHEFWGRKKDWDIFAKFDRLLTCRK
jgi:hypothetical protein